MTSKSTATCHCRPITISGTVDVLVLIPVPTCDFAGITTLRNPRGWSRLSDLPAWLIYECTISYPCSTRCLRPPQVGGCVWALSLHPE